MPRPLPLIASFVLSVVSVAAVSFDALAEDLSAEIDEIVVVAQKRPISTSNIAAAVTLLTQEDFASQLSAGAADVFRYTPGIDYESSGTRFGSESVNIRGISGNRVAVLVDGVPFSDQFSVGRYSNATRDSIRSHGREPPRLQSKNITMTRRGN